MAEQVHKPDWLAAHLPSLDGLRGLAIILVLLHHCQPRLISLGLGSLAAWGWIGVNLFFVLSGFLITGILLDERGTRHLFRNFYARRGLRVWPLYFVVFPLVYWGMGPHDSWSGGAAGWIFFLLYIQNLSPGLSGTLYPTWSLAIEEQFYLVWAPLVRFLSPRALAGLLVGVLAVGAGIRMHAVLTPVNTLYHLDGLAAGSLLALLIRLWPSGYKQWRRVGMATTVVGGLGWLWSNAWAPAYLNTALGVAFAGVLLLAALAPNAAGLNLRPLRFVGKISYGLYLVHMPIFALLGGLDEHMDRIHAGAAGDLLIVVVRWTAALLVAGMFWYGFERPILRLKRYFRPAAVAAPAVVAAPSEA
ncbi:MAG TPA: acyltransferase [Terriglobales bacterium]|jgi:peptidoglycan/LPS O-acetylase OafA/YrhL